MISLRDVFAHLIEESSGDGSGGYLDVGPVSVPIGSEPGLETKDELEHDLQSLLQQRSAALQKGDGVEANRLSTVIDRLTQREKL